MEAVLSNLGTITHSNEWLLDTLSTNTHPMRYDLAIAAHPVASTKPGCKVFSVEFNGTEFVQPPEVVPGIDPADGAGTGAHSQRLRLRSATGITYPLQ